MLATSQYQHLQSVFRIVPITTMAYNLSQAIAAADDDVEQSLKDATQFIESGGYLLGWTNPQTQEGSLAIGGGCAKAHQTLQQVEMIQKWVTATFFAQKPAVAAAPGSALPVLSKPLQLPNSSQPSNPYLNNIQIAEINKVKNQLKTELHSCWVYVNKSRKQEKINGLDQLLTDTTSASLADALQKIKQSHPTISKGFFSTRTAELLMNLELQSTSTLKRQP